MEKVNPWHAEGGGPVAPTSSARTVVQTLPQRAVTITGGFWGRRQTTNRVVSLPSGFVSLERAGTLENFRLVTGHGDAEEHRGEYFVDSDVYKWLEAVGWELGRGIDDDHAARLRVLADQAIALVERAQDGDGYLDTWFQVRAPDLRFTDLPAAHELYCAGHLFQAAVAWWRGVGDDRLLAVAGRLADHIGGVFGPERRQGLPGHPEVEMALVELYRTTGKQAYLDLARFFVDERGHRLLGEVHYGARYRQDDEPFRTAKQARGHAVRQAYLACGALDVAAETGDCALLDAAVAQWEDMVARRMYLTGGVGSRHKDEAFGDPFEFPPDRAYAETCAAIGVVMWSWRLLLATGDCRYADMIERALFNGFVVGLSLEGDTYFYVNPLQVRAGRADPEDGRGRAARSGWFDIACCPPNVMRTLASLQHYLATATETGVQLWQFAPSHLSVDVAAGRVELSVDTDYPLNGLISVRVDAATPGPLEIALRVPDWATGATGHLQGAEAGEAPTPLEAGRLWRTLRSWRPGDVLLLEFPIGARPVYPHPRIDAVRGCVAFERGPLVYCLEEVDAGGTDRFDALRVPADIALSPTGSKIGDEPMVALEGTAELVPADDAGTFPYRAQPWPAAPTTSAHLRLVPYALWGNRKPGQAMRVWLPLAARHTSDPPERGPSHNTGVSRVAVSKWPIMRPEGTGTGAGL